MSLKGDLKELEAARYAEVLYLHRTYLRTKREIRREIKETKRTLRRTLSPSRMIRKNPVTALGIAAVLGFLIAPNIHSGTNVEVSHEPPKKGPGIAGALRHVTSVLKHFMPKSQIPAPAPEEQTAESPRARTGPAPPRNTRRFTPRLPQNPTSPRPMGPKPSSKNSKTAWPTITKATADITIPSSATAGTENVGPDPGPGPIEDRFDFGGKDKQRPAVKGEHSPQPRDRPR